MRILVDGDPWPEVVAGITGENLSDHNVPAAARPHPAKICPNASFVSQMCPDLAGDWLGRRREQMQMHSNSQTLKLQFAR